MIFEFKTIQAWFCMLTGSEGKWGHDIESNLTAEGDPREIKE